MPVTPIEAWNAASKSGKDRGITLHDALRELAHACCYEASRNQWEWTDLEAFIEAFIEEKKEDWDKKAVEQAPFNAHIEARSAAIACGLDHCLSYNIASAWCSEVANNYPGKVTVLKDFIKKKKTEWDEYYKLLEDRAREKARRRCLPDKERKELEAKEKEERRAERY